MIMLKFNPDEVGWLKYCLIHTTTNKELDKKETNRIWRIIGKIEKQEKQQRGEG